MPNANDKKRRLDSFGLILFVLLILGAVAACAVLIEEREFTASGLVLMLVVGAAFAFAHHGLPKPAPPKNTQVHGAGRPASEQEAQRAARGEQKPKGARLDDREF